MMTLAIRRRPSLRTLFVASQLLALLLVGPAAPGRAAGSQGAFADAGIGARPLGMGGAYTAIADDIYSLSYNPAGLGIMNRYAIAFDYSNLWGMSEVNQSWFAGVIPTPWGNHGISYQSRQYDLGRLNREISLITADFRYTESLLKYSYGRAWGPFAVGTSVKYLSVTSNINQGTATGYGLDLGGRWQITERWSAGAAINDLIGSLKWGTGTTESLATSWSAGGAYKISDRWTTSAEFAGESGEAFAVFRAGTEYWIIQPTALSRYIGLSRERGESIFRREEEAEIPAFTLGVRTGFEKDLAGHQRYTPTFGASLGFSGLRLDYAFLYTDKDGLGSTNRFSLSYDFEPRPDRATPPAATPSAPAPAAPSAPAATTAPTTAIQNSRRIAVLDFANATGDREVAWLELGLADIVARELTQAGLEIVPRPSSTGTATLAMPEILTLSRQVNARFIIRGLFVRNAPGRMTLTTRVIDGMTGRTVEFVEAEAGEAEIFEIGRSAARNVAQRMGAWMR